MDSAIANCVFLLFIAFLDRFSNAELGDFHTADGSWQQNGGVSCGMLRLSYNAKHTRE